MTKIRFISDLHLGHKNIYKFHSSTDHSRLMRPFSSMKECEQLMVDNYNRVVKTDDITYFLGDIWFDKTHANILSKMKKGSKRLIMGNHDNKGDITAYRQYFDKIYGVLYLNKIKVIASHIPVHPRFLGTQRDGTVRFSHCIHGHTHDGYITNKGKKDPKFLNCSVEAVDYTPRTKEELLSYVI